ncbi:PF04286 domain protein [Leptospira fainei serovar Hurstbridge str. BUT 6]|uniref:PF04286 domain protein n=1 Tax=Leptospira fainei serovar Hurstbridge str. BUT 6 TaxID=1193011 RepID=S3VZ50_9LEPT|nr:DUF445 family protein [Leptospira fainei]EPG73362.1 PF04286 domain protein [Leptospira fainei serovar Hurstbridge str. BUT 6]
MPEWFHSYPDSIQVISIFLTCSFVGWITNYIAVQMIFFPNEFRGIGFLGWQGIIPHHAVKMSGLIANVLITRLISPYELYRKIQPSKIVDLIRDLIRLRSNEIVKNVLVAESPALWSMLPQGSKEALEKEIEEEIPLKIQEVYHSFGKELHKVLQVDELIRASLSGPNTKYLVEVFRRCGGPEFKFIVRSGIYFGFIIGSVQVAFIGILNQWWTMPIMGIIVGYLTNWLAIQMIFRPLEPRNFLFIKYQGLFLKRQKDVSKEFASVIAARVLTTENLTRLIFLGKGGDLIVSELVMRSKELSERKLKEKIPYAKLLIGTEKVEVLKEKIADMIVGLVPETAERMKGYLEETLKIEEVVYERLSVLPASEFEQLLHSVFKEDETTLIILGALLGGIAGCIQAFVVFTQF